MATETAVQSVGTLQAGGDLSGKQFCYAKFSADNTLVAAAAATDKIVGVIQNKPLAGEAVDLAILGKCKILLGGTVAAGDYLTSDANGNAIKATSADAVTFGQACEAGVAADLIGLLIPGGAAAGTGGGGAGSQAPVPLVVATSITDRVFYTVAPGVPFALDAYSGYAAVVAGSVVANGVIVPGGYGMITKGLLAVDAVPQKFKITNLSRYLVGGVYVEKAPATAIVFSAAHVVTNNLFGVILIQIDNTGTVTTKVPLATQAYASAPLALAALPTADAGKLAIGYLTIAPTAGDFTANTTSLTTANAGYVDGPVLTRVSTAGLTFASGTSVPATLGAAVNGAAADVLALLYTTDGSGALTNGSVTPIWNRT